MDTWEVLNSVYEPLYRRARSLCAALVSADCPAQWNWYALHSVRRGDEWQTEYFPIPVITAAGVCDVGLELDNIFLEGKLSREQAMEADFSALSWPFELYGSEDYLLDFYRPGMPMEDLRDRIAQSSETAVGLQLTLPPDCGDEALLRAVEALKRLGTRPC